MNRQPTAEEFESGDVKITADLSTIDETSHNLLSHEPIFVTSEVNAAIESEQTIVGIDSEEPQFCGPSSPKKRASEKVSIFYLLVCLSVRLSKGDVEE